MWHHSPLSIHKYVYLSTNEYIKCQKRNLDSAAAAQERERESYMAREYLYKLIEAWILYPDRLFYV
jgi:hypothetical protein